MRLVLLGYGLTKPHTYIYVGFSKCGPSLNDDKFYRDDNGVQKGYEESKFGRKTFTI